MSDGPGADAPFLKFILKCARALELSALQEAQVSRLYWASEGEPNNADSMRTVEAILSPDQLRTAIASFETNHNLGFDALVARSVDKRVAAAIAERLRDSSVVETEIAANAAGRLAGWAKLFAVFVALPLTLILIIFALWGFQRLQDVREAGAKVDRVIANSKSQIDASQRQIAASRAQLLTNGHRLAQLDKQLGPIISRARTQADMSSDQIRRIQEQLARNERDIATLGTTVQQVREMVSRGFDETGPISLGPSERSRSGASGPAFSLLECAVSEYNRNVREGGGDEQIRVYLRALGMPADTQIAWSGAFIGYCLRQSGAAMQIVPSAENYQMAQSARRSGLWHSVNERGFRLVPGDIYFAQWTSRDTPRDPNARQPLRIGIVRSVGAREIVGIEGNNRDRISLVTQPLPIPRLIGVARLRQR